MQLALDDHRVDHRADIVHRPIADDAHDSGLGVDLGLADMHAVAEGEIGRVVDGALVEAGLHGLVREIVRDQGGARDLGEAQAAIGAGDAEQSVAEIDVGLARFEQMRGEALALEDDLPGSTIQRRAADRDRARAEGAGAVGHDGGVALADLDHRGGDAEPRGEDLGEAGGVALAVIVGAERGLDAAAGLDPQRSGFVESGARAHGAGHARRRHARGFDVAGHADAGEPAAAGGGGAARGEGIVAAGGQRLGHHVRKIAAVIGRADRRLVGHRRGRHEVAAAQFGAVEAEFARRGIGQPLEHVARFRPSGAAIGVGGQRVGEGADHLHGDRRGAIHAGHQRAVDRAGNGGAHRGHVGAEIGHRAHPEAEEQALAVERQFGGGGVVARLVIGDEALGPPGDPAHRPAEPARRPGDHRLFGIVLALVAEAAADIGRDHAQRRLGQAELLRHQAADVMRHLRRRIERPSPGERVGHRGGGARLDGGAGDAVVDEVDLDDMGGAGEGAVHRRRVAARPAEGDIARRVGVDGLGLQQRGRRVRHRGQRRVGDIDQFGCIERRRRRLGQHHRHRLADMAHPPAGQRPARGLCHLRAVGETQPPQAAHRPDIVRRHVGAREHRRHAGQRPRRRRAAALDPRMGMRRAHEHGVQRARQREIGNEPPLTAQQPVVLLAQQRRADAGEGRP